MKKRFYTVPNIISLMRMLLAPVIFFLLIKDLRIEAFILYIIAALSDALDGYVARKFKQESSIGSLLDALSDRVFIVIVLLGLIVLDNLSWFVYVGIFVWLIEEFILGGVLTLKNKRIYLKDIHRNSIRAVAVVVYLAIGAMIIQMPLAGVHFLIGLSLVLVINVLRDYYTHYY